MKHLSLLILILSALNIIACNNNTSSGTKTPSHSYTWLNGSCYDNTIKTYVANTYCSGSTSYYMNNGICLNNSGQQVSTSYCNNSNSGSFYWNNGYCYSNAGQQVSTSYCSSQSTTNNGQCYGYFVYNGQTVYCNGYDCSGWTLIRYGTNTQVACQ